MVDGVDNSEIVLVFITNNYRNKVNQDDSRDNCRFEFDYAFRAKGNKRMVAIVMESAMDSTRDWRGYLSACLGGSLFINFSDAFTDDALFDQKIDELVKRIRISPSNVHQCRLGNNKFIPELDPVTNGSYTQQSS
jgi:hypothetical protein